LVDGPPSPRSRSAARRRAQRDRAGVRRAGAIVARPDRAGRARPERSGPRQGSPEQTMTKGLARFSAVLAFLSACSILEPRKDPTRFFAFSPSAEVGTLPAKDPALAISVGPVHLPDYLLRPEIVRRVGPNQLEPSRVDRWAEPVDRALVRILCLDLAAVMPQSSIVAFPPSPAEKSVLQVELELSAFEGDETGGVRLEGPWYLRDLRTGSRFVPEFRLERKAASTETPALVAAMSAMLAEVAGSIAHEVGASSTR